MLNPSLRYISVAGTLGIAALICAAAYAGLGLKLDSFNGILIAIYTALVVAQVWSLPKKELSGSMMVSVFALQAGTLLVYTSDAMPVLAAGWLLSAIPMIWTRDADGERWGLPALALIMSFLALLVAIFVLPEPGMHRWAFGAFTLALVFRKGIFPAQSWVPAAFERKPLWLANLTVNGHLGAVLAARVAIPLLVDDARSFTQLVSGFALMTAIGSALAALREKRPRRILAWLFSSQAAIILAGLESADVEGIAGSYVHMIVVTLATTALVIVYQSVEARFGGNLSAEHYSGLASRMPRLAAFFIVTGLALVGLPGTLGFPAEDLLLHGTMSVHPLIGIVLPLSTALNAWNLFRLYSRIFLGKGARAVPEMVDALPRERWVLTAFAAALILGGLAPQFIVNSRTHAAESLKQFLIPVPSIASLR
ncbi:proton-conducting transporter membrane subunit [Bryobacter aggregatus]|uniref:proton-conducting transporter transmembrane domain-containing protein n=1 Tax=Bryobacter aggregatus TaxID=360054 RepID=UPI0004E27EDB|nr:proton-conducting transporter membrane subunit [Bryobacter aggregatus]